MVVLVPKLEVERSVETTRAGNEDEDGLVEMSGRRTGEA
jgi:hypothetical protein